MLLRGPARARHDAQVGARGRSGLWLLASVGPLLLAASGAARLAGAVPGGFDVTNVYPNVVFGGAMPLLGALVLTRLPRHPIGLLFLGCGLASAVTIAVYDYAAYGLVLHPGSLPGALAAAWVSSWVWTLGFAPLMTIGVLLFPDGRLPSPRWRVVAWIEVVDLALLVAVNALQPGKLQNHPVADNPLGVPVPAAVVHVMQGLFFAVLLAGLVTSCASLVLRWRRGAPAERAQLGWFTGAVVLLVSGVLLPLQGLSTVLALIAIPLLPLSVAVAVLRRHLYGIDVVVRRSLVYGTLSAVLLAAYGVAIITLGALLGGGQAVSVRLGATAVVAVGFAPVRERLQRAANRLLYGDRRDPYAVLSGLGRSLETPSAGDDDTSSTLDEIVATVARSLRLPFVRVTVGHPGGRFLVAERGKPVADVTEIPLRFREEAVGSLEVAPRTPHDPFRAADLRLLEDLGRQIGVAAHAMLLTRDLQRSREQLVTLREEERRRIRRDLHDGLGPALAGVALGLDAVERLAPDDPAGASRLASELRTEVQDTLSEVRRLVEDLRPPDLDQLGLVAALRRHADRVTARDPGLCVDVDADGLPPLPAAVEVAAYRIATEALTNVARHAGARRCLIGLGLEPTGSLRIDVQDDGVGIPAGHRMGVGLSAMRERATELGGTYRLGASPTGGTRVEAWLPVAVPS